jgi:protein-S-isoprenylcysteine O-methyltransferase Ste14
MRADSSPPGERRRILPVAWLLIALLSMVGLHRFWPLGDYLGQPWSYVGAVPLVFGLYMTVSAAASFRRAETGLVPFSDATLVVTTGFFRYTRNPMYLGMVFSLAGLSMLMGTLATLLPIPAFIWVIQRNFIRAEERFMERTFGAEYRAYRERVRRWL